MLTHYFKIALRTIKRQKRQLKKRIIITISGKNTMSLKDVLMKLARDKTPILLSDGNQDWKVDTLLETLSEPMLKRNAYFQQGLYIAEINNGGYLGQVLYKVKQRT